MPYARHWGGHPHEFGEGKSKIVGQLASRWQLTRRSTQGRVRGRSLG